MTVREMVRDIQIELRGVLAVVEVGPAGGAAGGEGTRETSGGAIGRRPAGRDRGAVGGVMTTLVALIAGIWIGGWSAVLWSRRQMKQLQTDNELLRSGHRKLMDCYMDKLRAEHKLILELAKTDIEVARLTKGMADLVTLLTEDPQERTERVH